MFTFRLRCLAVHWSRVADPFQREAQLQLQTTYYPLGFELHLKTNCEHIVGAAEELWGGANKLFDEPPMELRVIVAPGGAEPAPPIYRSQAHLMTAISDADNFAICDYTRNLTVCRLTENVAKRRPFVAYYYLKGAINYAFAQLYLTPVHAACVAWNGRGVLLCGHSGAGKTTLAYACARKGWTYISDNESWLVRAAAGNLLVGDSRRIRFRPDAQTLFPELQDQQNQIVPAHIQTADTCQIARVVYLSKNQSLLEEIPLYEDHVRNEHRKSLEKLEKLDPIELQLRDLDEAEKTLRRLVE
jgi:hypothetical protein